MKRDVVPGGYPEKEKWTHHGECDQQRHSSRGCPFATRGFRPTACLEITQGIHRALQIVTGRGVVLCNAAVSLLFRLAREAHDLSEGLISMTRAAKENVKSLFCLWLAFSRVSTQPVLGFLRTNCFHYHIDRLVECSQYLRLGLRLAFCEFTFAVPNISGSGYTRSDVIVEIP